VVQAFLLPKYKHVVTAYSTDSSAPDSIRNKNIDAKRNSMEADTAPTITDILDHDDVEMGNVTVLQPEAGTNNEVPISIRELANAARQRSIGGEDLQPSMIRGPTTVNTMLSTKRVSRYGQRTPPERMAYRLRASTRKRARDESESERPAFDPKHTREDDTSAYPLTPTRILRPRASKSAAQLQDEREKEQAYIRAIAD